LYAADRNDRWLVYDDLGPSRDAEPLLAEIEQDPPGSSGADGRESPDSSRGARAQLPGRRRYNFPAGRATTSRLWSRGAYAEASPSPTGLNRLGEQGLVDTQDGPPAVLYTR